MNVIKVVLILTLSQSLLFACSKKNKPVPIDLQCDGMVKQALKQYEENKSQLDRSSGQQITGLINSAKIQQQHGKFPDCIDKASRAITLIEQNTKK